MGAGLLVPVFTRSEVRLLLKSDKVRSDLLAWPMLILREPFGRGALLRGGTRKRQIASVLPLKLH